MFLKALIVLCVLLNCDINCQICNERTVVKKVIYVNYKYSYIERYTKKNWLNKVVYRTRQNTALGTKPVEKEEVQFVPKCCDNYIRADNGSLDDMDCIPICTPACENGRCVEPGECECTSGYIQDFENPHKCEPLCDVCLHGTCVAPNDCRCNYGYSKPDGITCAPICSEPCVNSTCVAPGICQCNYGYRKTDDNVCLPYCSRGCIHGMCTAPENCTCNEGWQKSERDRCVPKCDVQCGNGTCTGPNTCKCADGYKDDEGHDPRCVPHCEASCGNGTCVATEECVCDEGYDLDTNKNPVCVPKCDIDCGNGVCISPNHCICDIGFTNDKDSNPICVPHCKVTCGNGICVAPDVCECQQGYKREINKEPICVPQCDFQCGNGSCIAPNKCECIDGYYNDADKIPRCVPKCHITCGNGTCVAPETCDCNEGYAFDIENSPACVPQCENKCGNGICIAPNECKCFEGYKNEGNESTCVPDCGDCEGHCFKSGLCECDELFKAIRVTVDGKDCDVDIENCTRTVCRIDNKEPVTYGYDDINTNDFNELRNISTEENANNDSYYDYNYDGIIVNNTIVREDGVENQKVGNDNWLQSKWGYVVISVVAVIFAVIVGSLVVFRKTLKDCCIGTHYDVTGATANNVNAERSTNAEMRLSTILKKRGESTLSGV